ncbi:MAG TPA: iron-containing redox enzyme family protein [Nocardioidaceae bacterium]|nr:iron-containing redox enzyme family protein [Nocardioidaceae bacterium]
MRLPSPRGPMSRWCVDAMTGASPPDTLDAATVGLAEVDPLTDDDVQLALWMLYELHYQGFDEVDPALEWEPRLLGARREIERRFEAVLRERTDATVDAVVADSEGSADIAGALFGLCADDDAPDVLTHLHRSGDRSRLLELLAHRSVYQLKEADPHTWMMPRLRGAAKAALLEIQYDEYGAGRAEDIHATLFADTLEACGLDNGYGAYVEDAPGATLAISNTGSMFGLHRRLRGAAAGHFAAVEATSSLPSRRMSATLERFGFGAAATRFYDEHVEADAVHEQVATRGLCGSLVEQHPELRGDVFFGAAACLLVESRFAHAVLTAWQEGSPSLRRSAPDGSRAERATPHLAGQWAAG